MKKRIHTLNIAIAVCIALIIVLLAVHTAIIHRDNHMLHTVIGNDSSEPVYMDIDFRKDSTSRWQKRNYDLYGETVDITGTTIDETLYNNAKYSLRAWTLRINILGDCFINQAWNGQVEIHQYVGTEDESVQKLNLQNYELDEVKLDYLYDGDLLIPLHAGDYVIYYPSDNFNENTLASDSKLTIGVIFYFLDSIDLSDYKLDYTYNRGFTQGHLFYLILFIAFGLFTGVVVAISTVMTFNITQREQERQKQAVSCMSDIYQIIYIINPVSDELIPVHADEASEKLRPQGKGAREQISSMFVWDAEDNYQQIMQEFADLDTVGERLMNRNSIACEYLSKHYGWCLIRIFGMDSEAGKAPEKVLFTIQVIDDEKRELENIKARASTAEAGSKVQSVILGRISEHLKKTLITMADTSSKLVEMCNEPEARDYAEQLNRNSVLLLAVTDGIIDYSELQSGILKLRHEPYSLKCTISEVCRIAETMAVNNGLTIKQQLSDCIPDMVLGDNDRLKQALVHIIAHAVKCTESGEIRLTMYGKVVDGHLHLLFSVSAEGKLLREKTVEQGSDHYDLELNVASGIIERMGYELKIISGNVGIYELYFEINQDLC